MGGIRYFFLLLTCTGLMCGCGNQPSTATRQADASSAPSSATNATTPVASNRVFTVKGVIQEVYPDGKTVKIRHEAITNYMPAMTMDFDVKNTNELRGLKSNDVVTFHMVVNDKEGWLEDLQKLNVTPTQAPSRETFRVAREVEPLKIGDLMPDYHFTNELGQAVSLHDFKGQAMVFTFFFTRCPFPNFCPRMSGNFATTQNKLLQMPDGPKNWHLFSISFDPEHDSVAVLQDYAKKHQYDPQRWSFLTGDLIDITAISEQFGQQFWTDEQAGGINHNIRTVVIDASGHVQKIIPGNTWTPDELVNEIIAGAKKK